MEPVSTGSAPNPLDRTLRTGALVMALAGGLVLLAITGVTVVNVTAFGLDRIARMFGASVGALPGYEDFVRLAVGAAILLMLPWCQLNRGHVAVDLFVSFMPATVRRAVDRLSLALVAVLALFLAWWMTQGMLEVRSDRLVSRVLGWPEWPFYAPGIAALTLWGLIAIRQLFGDPDHG